MTIPWMHNCPHSDDSWCLACVIEMGHEMDALRAAHEALLRRTQSLETALDQERAKVAALRETIEACGEWSPNSRGKLIFHFGDRWIADDQTLALLSGRPKESPH